MDWEKFATSYGLPGLMIFALVYIGKLWLASNERIRERELQVEDKKADAWASALSSIGGKIDAHHTADIQAHGELRASMAELKGSVAEAINWQERTPVEQPIPRRVPTPPRGVYSHQRAKTQGGG